MRIIFVRKYFILDFHLFHVCTIYSLHIILLVNNICIEIFVVLGETKIL